MQMTPQKIADTFVGMAARAPNNRVRADILRRGAATFAGMASDPNLKSERARNFLTHIGLEFAGASAQAAQSPTTSDFTQLLRDTAQAWEELGPEGAALTSAAMNAQALQAGIANANNPGINQGVSVAPASWAGANVTLGRSAMVVYNPSSAQIQQGILASQTVAFWQGARQEAQAMTIDFTMVAPPTNPAKPQRGGGGPDQESRPMAIVQYGVDGNTQYSVPVDVGQGRRITVPANYISVNVGCDPPFSGGEPVPITLGASIGMFQAASVSPPTRTVTGEIPFGGVESDFFAIPVRASRLLPPVVVTGSLPGGLSFQINWCRLSGQIIGTVSYDYTTLSAGTLAQPVVVPYDAFFFTVQGTVQTDARFPFELSL